MSIDLFSRIATEETQNTPKCVDFGQFRALSRGECECTDGCATAFLRKPVSELDFAIGGSAARIRMVRNPTAIPQLRFLGRLGTAHHEGDHHTYRRRLLLRVLRLRKGIHDLRAASHAYAAVRCSV